MDLRVAPHVCMETLPTVMWELVRMLPTAGLVGVANYPQCEGSVQCMHNGGFPEPLSHTADRFWSTTAQCRFLV